MTILDYYFKAAFYYDLLSFYLISKNADLAD